MKDSKTFRPPVLEIHPLCLAMPAMLESELAALTADINAHGLRDPITIYNGKILDGRHRWDACIKLGIKPQTVEFKGSEAKAKAFVISANVHRRHLTPEQKRAIVEAELKRDPAQSDRAIAKKANRSPTYVGNTRAELEKAGALSTVDSRTGLDGRTTAVARKSSPRATPSNSPATSDEPSFAARCKSEPLWDGPAASERLLRAIEREFSKHGAQDDDRSTMTYFLRQHIKELLDENPEEEQVESKVESSHIIGDCSRRIRKHIFELTAIDRAFVFDQLRQLIDAIEKDVETEVVEGERC